MHSLLTRRQALHSLALGSLGLGSLALSLRGQNPVENLPPVRVVTRGPKHHWFGYYDKLQFDPTSRYLLGMEVGFEHRSPRPDDVIRIGMVDLGDNDRWIDLGESRAWGWQQGCMLQWLPGSDRLICWNDREKDAFVCRILDVRTRELRTLPSAIYSLAPDGKTAVTCDYRRLNDVRPGYGYAGIADPNRDEKTPARSGLWRVDMATGKSELILSLADVVKFGELPADATGAKHWFNHLLYSPDGRRFIFLHRWRPEGQTGFRTRMLTVSPEGKDLAVIDPSGFTSHFIWRDEKTILAWTRPFGRKDGFYLIEDRTAKTEQIGEGIMTENGHCTYLPGNRWILNDTYPDRLRLQHPYLYEIATRKKLPLGHFLSPKEYAGEWRCDTHPRFSPCGKLVCIDSPHREEGRQLHVLDISKLIGA